MEYINCNLCQADSYEVIWEEKDFRWVICKKCGLVYLNPRIDEKQTNTFYQGYSQQYPKAFLLGKESPLLSIARERLEFILGMGLESRGKAMEIGCSYGHFLFLLENKGWEVHGVEPSFNEASFARDEFGLKSIYQTGIEETAFPEEHFDLVTLFHVLEHLRDPQKTIRLIYKMLKDGGKVLIDIPNINNLPITLIEYFELASQQHLYAFSPVTIKSLLESNNLEIIYNNETPLAVNTFSSNLRILAVKTKKEKYALNNDYGNVEPYLKAFIKEMEYLRYKLTGLKEEWRSAGKKVLIYGGGYHTQTLLRFVDFSNCNIVGIIDDDKKKWGKHFAGYHVYSPEFIKELKPQVILISSLGAQEIIYNKIKLLEKNGIEIVKIY